LGYACQFWRWLACYSSAVQTYFDFPAQFEVVCDLRAFIGRDFGDLGWDELEGFWAVEDWLVLEG